MKEGVYWAFMGRPFEVMPFLRGKLLKEANGRQKSVEKLLEELESLYKEISMSSRISEEQMKLVMSYREKILECLKS